MHIFAKAKGLIVSLALCATLGACAASNTATTADGIYDPFEVQNRKIHASSVKLDKNVIRPVSQGYQKVVPEDIQLSIGNFAENLDRPGYVVNALLQGDLRGAGVSTVRFLVNSTFGFAGFFDAASDFDIPEHDTDFGETLHVWGAGEGAYLVLPVLGPSTTRDTVGRAVDFFTNPLSYELKSPEQYYGTVAGVADRIGDRGRFTDTIDSILYESADSYAQARLIYLQNRRFELGDTTATSEIDPFALDTEGF